MPWTWDARSSQHPPGGFTSSLHQCTDTMMNASLKECCEASPQELRQCGTSKTAFSLSGKGIPVKALGSAARRR